MNMRKVTLTSLGGHAYQLEEAAHEKIAAYLDRAARTLSTNPDRAEILTDLEQAIADKCDSFLGKHKTVISADEAMQILREMGPVQGVAGADDDDAWVGGGNGGAATADAYAAGYAASASAAGRKRLMRIPSEGMMGGVCSGIAAYVDIDVVWVRMAFVVLTFVTGIWLLVWLSMLVVMPAARTPEQMASVRGETLSARELMDIAKKKSADLGRAAASGLRDAQTNIRDTLRPRG
jgi:phage shock protein PspC (stress-responsive transcriptional regulator)